MAGLVIIDNLNNTLRQVGNTLTSALLRSVAYTGFLFGREAKYHFLSELKYNEKLTDYTGKLSGIDPSKYDDKYRLFVDNQSDYSKYMPFMVDKKPYGNVIMGSIDGERMVEFIDAKLRIVKANTIVETALSGSRGTIKEYIGAQDYAIDIELSLFTGNSGYFPYDELNELNELLSLTENFSIASRLLEIYDVTSVVLESAEVDQRSQKFQNIVPITLRLKSDNGEYGIILE